MKMLIQNESFKRMILFIPLLFFVSPLFAYNLYLSDKVKTVDTKINLNQIVRVHGKDAGDIGKTILFSSLQKPYYLSAVELHTKLNPSPEKIYGKGVWIFPKAQTFTSSKLQNILEKQMKEMYGKSKILDELDIQVQKDTVIALPSSDFILKYQLSKRIQNWKLGKRVISLDLYPKGTSKKRVFYRFQIPIVIHQWIQAAIANKDLFIGQRISEDDFSWERRSIFDESIRYASFNLNKRRVMTSVSKGQVLTNSNVQPIPSVFRGQKVRLVYQKGSLVFRFIAVAMSPGDIGENISIKIIFLDGRQSLPRKARILSEKEVELIDKEYLSGN